jgi:hypothetical protein
MGPAASREPAPSSTGEQPPSKPLLTEVTASRDYPMSIHLTRSTDVRRQAVLFELTEI